MKVHSVNSVNSRTPRESSASSFASYARFDMNKNSRITFKGGPVGGGFGKNGWLILRRLADQMRNITEIKNAFIAAIGTGIIAPAIILVSPGKNDEEDKKKKFIQALRQPLSAGLQLGFQVPATMYINREIDGLAYDKKVKFFRDDIIGDLIPTEKYLAKNVKDEEIEALNKKFEEVIDGKSLKQELEAKIKLDYDEVGLKISDDEMTKRVNKEKKDFLKSKIARDKVEKIKQEKIQEMLKNPDKYPIKEIDLVTEDYQNLAKHRFKAEYSQLEKNANLTIFDKAMRLLGFDTKKTKLLKDKQEVFGKEKGLEILKKDKPEIFENQAKKIRSYIEAYEKQATKSFNGKKFWLSLLVNLFMVTVSCFTLNWIHPKVNKWIENRRAQKEEIKNQKVEVK